jgi:hypothetical protein
MISPKKYVQRHSIIKLLKSKDKEKILKNIQKKAKQQHLTHCAEQLL